MAKAKTTSSANGSYQVLEHLEYRDTKGGGQLGHWVTLKKGENLVRPARVEDIRPRMVCYLRTHQTNVFYAAEFSSLCHIQMIEDMVKGGYIYVER